MSELSLGLGLLGRSRSLWAGYDHRSFVVAGIGAAHGASGGVNAGSAFWFRVTLETGRSESDPHCLQDSRQRGLRRLQVLRYLSEGVCGLAGLLWASEES